MFRLVFLLNVLQIRFKSYTFPYLVYIKLTQLFEKNNLGSRVYTRDFPESFVRHVSTQAIDTGAERYSNLTLTMIDNNITLLSFEIILISVYDSLLLTRT